MKYDLHQKVVSCEMCEWRKVKMAHRPLVIENGSAREKGFKK